MPASLLAFILILGLCLGCADLAPAATWYLDPGGDDLTGTGAPEAPYRSLAHAIAGAAGGDSLLLAPGLYTGEGQHDLIIQGIGLEIIGLAGSDSTSLDLDSLGAGFTFLDAPLDSSRLTGLTIRGGLADVGAALRLKHGFFRLTDCVFTDNAAGEDGGAVYVHPDATAHMDDCRFTGNRADDNGGAVYVSTGAGIELRRCAFGDNLADEEGGAIFLAATALADIENCLLTNNRAEARMLEKRLSGLPGDQSGYGWVDFPPPPVPWDGIAAAELHLTSIWLERAGLPGAPMQLELSGFGCFDMPTTQSEEICHPDYSDADCLNLFASWMGDSLLPMDQPWLWPPDSLLTIDGNIFDCAYEDACACWVAPLDPPSGERGWVDEVAAFTIDLELRWHSSGHPRVGGGALSLDEGAQAQLLHCTLAVNSSGLDGGALALAPTAFVQLRGCILSGNTAARMGQIALCPDASADLLDCAVDGEDWGPGNLSLPPAFIDMEDFPAGFALADSSPCIAVGNGESCPGEDMDGTFRPNPPATPPDLGCYESPRGSASSISELEASTAGLPILSLHPNPSNPNCELTVLLDRDSRLELSLLDVAGRRVRELWRGPLAAGAHRFAWDGRDDSGRMVSSGVYLLKAATPTGRRAMKVVLLR
jgi:predicted outer membrane repeat protein